MTEEVRGTVIGSLATEKPYAFYDLSGNKITVTKWFESDEEAIKWFKKGWPKQFEVGAEMRCWD